MISVGSSSHLCRARGWAEVHRVQPGEGPGSPRLQDDPAWQPHMPGTRGSEPAPEAPLREFSFQDEVVPGRPRLHPPTLILAALPLDCCFVLFATQVRADSVQTSSSCVENVGLAVLSGSISPRLSVGPLHFWPVSMLHTADYRLLYGYEPGWVQEPLVPEGSVGFQGRGTG